MTIVRWAWNKRQGILRAMTTVALTVIAIVAILWAFDVIGDNDDEVVQQPTAREPFVTTDSPVNGNTPDINNTYAGNSCPGDKVSTINEVNAAGPQRIEVGGGGIQHVDYYPDRGVPAVSYIVPPSEPGIWFGFGSIWEWQCTGFDFVADATRYAQGRMNNGHSGLVVDLRSGTPQLVANVAKLTEQQIRSLMALHNAGQQSSPVMLASFSGSTSVQTPTQAPTQAQPATSQYQAPAPQAQPAAPAQAAQPAPSCDGVRGPDFVPVPGIEWNPEPTDSFRVVSFWSNWPGMDQSERKFLLFPGEVSKFQGGGSFWYWPSNCQKAAEDAYSSNPLPPGR